MTPKEKAKEIIKKYSTHLPYYSEKDNKNKSKQCALIAVDEILDYIQEEDNWYWQDVKHEIEKL